MKAFIKRHKIGLIILGLCVLVCIPLLLTNPSEAELVKKLPESITSVESKRENVVYKDYKIMSCYILTKQISTARAERAILFGIAGTVINATDNPPIAFICNCMSWLPNLLEGAKITILLTLTSVVVGVFLSIFLALGKMAKLKPLRAFCNAYIFFFRGTPLLMQLFFIYYGLPMISPVLAINNRFAAAWVAFSLNTAAYCAEIIRAGIQSIDRGQFEAAKALGFSYGLTMRKIIIPQTYRRLMPPIANEFIMVLKDASLTSIIALQDLSKITQSIMTSSSNFTVFFPSMALYLIITAIFTKLFNHLEKKFSIYE